MDTFIFKGKPHFGVECSCGKSEVVEIPPEAVAAVSADPVAGLYVINAENRNAIVEFWRKHKEMGHELSPTLCEIGPLNKGKSN